jgi:hypothetical protein
MSLIRALSSISIMKKRMENKRVNKNKLNERRLIKFTKVMYYNFTLFFLSFDI